MTAVLIGLLGALGLALLVVAFIFASEQSGGGGTRTSTSTIKNPRQKLKRATELKREGQLDDACDYLSDLIRKWERNPPTEPAAGIPEDYPEWKVYWKLANYLQKAGRSEEGWEVLQRLMSLDYPRVQAQIDFYKSESTKETEPEQTLSRELAQIYDKVRLFSDREGNPEAAVRFGVLSHAADAKSLWYAGQESSIVKNRFEDTASDSAIEGTIDGVMGDSSDGEARSALFDKLRAWIDGLPDSELASLSDAVADILSSDSGPEGEHP